MRYREGMQARFGASLFFTGNNNLLTRYQGTDAKGTDAKQNRQIEIAFPETFPYTFSFFKTNSRPVPQLIPVLSLAKVPTPWNAFLHVHVSTLGPPRLRVLPRAIPS